MHSEETILITELFLQVTIEFNQTNNVKPKTDVNLRVTADKDSVVNVLVYDRSLRLLKDGNDITRQRVSLRSQD